MKTKKGFFKKKTKIMLSNYWDQIDGFRNYEEIERDILPNPIYRETFGEFKYNKQFVPPIRDICYLMRNNPGKNLFQLCKNRSLGNELIWKILLFIYENDRVQVRKDKILKLKSKIELKRL